MSKKKGSEDWSVEDSLNCSRSKCPLVYDSALLIIFHPIGGLAEWSNAVDSKSILLGGASCFLLTSLPYIYFACRYQQYHVRAARRLYILEEGTLGKR